MNARASRKCFKHHAQINNFEIRSSRCVHDVTGGIPRDSTARVLLDRVLIDIDAADPVTCAPIEREVEGAGIQTPLVDTQGIGGAGRWGLGVPSVCQLARGSSARMAAARQVPARGS